jgi:hypothetical protein
MLYRIQFALYSSGLFVSLLAGLHLWIRLNHHSYYDLFLIMAAPSLGGNVFFLACHAALLPIQIFFGIRYKTWGYLFSMFSGLLLEVIGYVARVQWHFGENTFLT